jgi:hypothetical protein
MPLRLPEPRLPVTMVDHDELTTTRRSLHALAEHVMAAALWQHKRRIGLRQSTGGFTTPPFFVDGVERRLFVSGVELGVEHDDGRGNMTADAQPITTLRAAGELVDISPGMSDALYPPTPAPALDVPLVVDAGAADELARTLALGQAALTVLVAERAHERPATVQLWPEHFDLATTIGEVNFGLSLGDDEHAGPYLYVGPWNPPSPDEFWNERFGASRPVDDSTSVDQALEFFEEAQRRLG